MRGCEQSIASVEAIDLSKANGDCGFWLGESIPSLAVSTVWHNKGIAGQSPPVRCPCSSVSSDAPDATGDLAGPARRVHVLRPIRKTNSCTRHRFEVCL
jgi:hypothetical protein